MFEFLMLLLVGGGFLVLIIALILYLLGAIGLYKLAKNKGLNHSFLAFIPVLQGYIIGMLISELKVFKFDISRPEIVLPVAPILASVLSPIPVIGVLVAVALIILNIFALHKLFSIYVRDSATIYTVLSVVLPFMLPIFLFVIRNKMPIAYAEIDLP